MSGKSWYENIAKRQVKAPKIYHAGTESYPLTSRIRAVALARLREDVLPKEALRIE